MRTRSQLRVAALGALLAAATACGDDAPVARAPAASTDPASGAYAVRGGPDGPCVRGRHYKVTLASEDDATYAALRDAGAVVDEVDYGSFKMAVVDAVALGGRERLDALAVQVHDEYDHVPLHGIDLDTCNPGDAYRRLPPGLTSAAARGGGDEAHSATGLYVIQFIGPVRREWLEGLLEAGVEVVTYVPENAFVVRADADEAQRLLTLPEETRFVQFVGEYEPGFRLAPELRVAQAEHPVDVMVQVVDGPGVAGQLAALRALSVDFVQSYQVMNFHDVELRVELRRLPAIASLPDVFSVAMRMPRGRHDEVQGQILAGNLAGNLPSGPGYLAWLEGRGFSGAQFGSFAVHVVDDAYALGGHPDLPGARIAFQHNPTAQTGAQGGHGFLNAHILAGYNAAAGAAYEDAAGYHYGLGIAPWARVGATAIFGSGASSATSWERAAYDQGARVSSNSWGYLGTMAYRYDASAQEYDRIVRDAQSATAGLQPMVVVFAAGNSGSGANTVTTPATAKNVITVGAGEGVRPTGTDGCAVGNTGADSANDIINFSSRGPVNAAGGDGRVKPDLVAPGTHVQAGVPQSNYDGSSVCNQYFPAGQTLYGWSSGTSHACPAVAGGAALVYQHFLNQGRAAPSPAMVKAWLMGAATHMTGAGANDTLPSNNQGMGRMDLGRALDATPRILVDQRQVLAQTGAIYQVTGSVASAATPFRVTLAWTDAPGPTTGAPWVNNLDLEVTVNGATYRGNVFAGRYSTTGGSADGRNNVESVFLPAGASGTFTVTVRGANIPGDGVPGNADLTDQDFALVVYNAVASAATAPSIGVSPSSLAFAGTAGGASPASQTLSISNTGGGTLTWSASDSASWLTVSPTSGTAPSAATVSVNTSGLAAGTYNATITLMAVGASNSPRTVPVVLTVSPGGGGEDDLVVNGGFEATAAPWVLSGNAYHTTSGAYPASGSGYAYLGATNYASGAAYQQITIPSTATSANLSFRLNITSSETTTTTQYDRLYVEVRSTTGALLATLATYSNLGRGTAGVYSLRGPFNLLAYRGQTVRIQFRATTDSSYATTFRVDDVSVK